MIKINIKLSNIKEKWLQKSGTNKIYVNLTYAYENGLEPQEILEFDVFKFPNPNYIIKYIKDYIKKNKLKEFEKNEEEWGGLPYIHINIYQELNTKIEFIDEIKDKLKFEDYENEKSLINGKYLYNIAYFQISLKKQKEPRDLRLKKEIIDLIKKNCKNCKTEEDFLNFLEDIFEIENCHY